MPNLGEGMSQYTDKEFERGVEEVISRYFIKEHECPVCKQEANFVKVVECQPYWRCMSCLAILERTFVKAKGDTLPEIDKTERAERVEDTEPDEWEISRARAELRAKKIAETAENDRSEIQP